MLLNAVKYFKNGWLQNMHILIFFTASTRICKSNKEMTQNMQRELVYLEHYIMHVCGRKWINSKHNSETPEPRTTCYKMQVP